MHMFKLFFKNLFYQRHTVINYFDGTTKVIKCPDGYLTQTAVKGYFDNDKDNVTVKSVKIGRDVKYIGMFAFQRCVNLTDVVISNTVNVIDYNAFDGCRALTKIIIPGNVKEIRSWSFGHCVNLRDVVIQAGVKVIYDYAFYGCQALTNFNLPKTVTMLRHWIFYDCLSLPTDDFGVRYENLDDKQVLIRCPKSFNGEFVVPKSVKYIHSAAFYGCSGLTKITITKNVKSLAYQDIFHGCSSLTVIDLSDYDDPPDLFDLNTLPDVNQKFVIYIKRGTLMKWLNDDNWFAFRSRFRQI